MTTLTKTSAVLPAGAYVVGDPCYMVPDEEWDIVLTRSDFFEGQCHASFKTETGEEGLVVAFSTAHGDGEYHGSDGHSYGVDAGLIGIAPAECFNGVPEDCHFIEFHRPVHCHAENGVITFGHLEINTEFNSDDLDQGYFGEDNDDIF